MIAQYSIRAQHWISESSKHW